MQRSRSWKIKGDVSALGVAPTTPFGLSPLTAEILRLRGLWQADEQLAFLKRKSLRDLSDFWRLPGMVSGVNATRLAIEANKNIWIYGDFDADGTTATALLVLRVLEISRR